MPGRRGEERFETELTVWLEGGAEGVARNVSASGIFFVTDEPLQAGQPVKLRLKFLDFPSGPIEVQCSARVVRVEEQGAGWGVGASIGAFEFQILREPARAPTRTEGSK